MEIRVNVKRIGKKQNGVREVRYEIPGCPGTVEELIRGVTAEIEALLIFLWGQWGYQRLIINVINHQPGVVLRRRHVIQTLVHVGQLSDKCRIVR